MGVEAASVSSNFKFLSRFVQGKDWGFKKFIRRDFLLDEANGKFDYEYHHYDNPNVFQAFYQRTS